jgi:hypothetical protein
MKLEQLHREKLIQAHHWRAAIWLQENSADKIALREISHACTAVILDHSHKKINGFDLLITAVVHQKEFYANDKSTGVLRECLNIVARHAALREKINQVTAGQDGKAGKRNVSGN